MKRILLLAALTLAAPVQAETVRLLSGEHGGFSRLAMVLQEPKSWQLGRDGQAYMLRVDDPDLKIDAARAFNRIGRQRIGAVSVPRPGELRVDLACNCRANAFEERPGVLVIDIHDGPPLPGSPFEAPLPSLVALPPSPQIPPLAPDDNAIYWRNLLGEATPAAGTGLEPNIGLSLAREELMSRLARAAAQGVVDIGNEVGGETATSGSPLMHVETVLDRDLGVRRDRPASATVCIAAERVALGQWAGPAPFAEQIGAARTNLLGEFDRPDHKAVTRLARLYLHYGLGVEATALIAAFPDAVEDAPLLLTLAAIVEGVPERAPKGILSGQVLCDGPVALWALLADPAPGLLREIARGSILRALPELSPDLRRQIGPELSRRLLERGDSAAAQEVETILARVRPGAPAPAELLAQARLDQAAGRDAPASLERLASLNDPESPEALLMLVNDRLSRDQPVGPDLVTAAGTLAFELRAEPLAPQLARAHILSLGSTGAFEAAYEALDRLPETKVLPGLRGELLAQLTAAATDQGFLRYSLRPGGLPPDVPAPVLAAMVTRLLDLGFPAEARAILSRLGLPGVEPQIVARAALDDGDPRGALRALSGLTGAPAEAIRASALQSLGDYEGAGRAWQAAGDAQAAGRLAWRAGDWAAVGAAGRPEEQAIAARMRPASGASAPTDAVNEPVGTQAETDTARNGRAPAGMLARNKALLTETQTLRTELEAVLRLHPDPRE